MSTGELPAGDGPAGDTGTSVELTYADASRVTAEGGGTRLNLVGDLHRPLVRLEGKIKDPLRVREGLATLYAVVGSDFRYKPRDRTAYLAYLRMRREAAAQSARQAQQTFFAWVLRNDPTAFLPLDPIITVHPDRVLFEVFSKDEGSYAQLGIDHSAFEVTDKPSYGTTNIDFSQYLYAGVEQMRSYRDTRIAIGREAVQLATPGTGQVVEKRIRVPDTWLRGFLQVQSAATLPLDTFRLAPIDFYNLLRHLRMHGDRKGQRRGLRIELVPGEPARIVLEPWETVLTSSAGNFTGRAARVLRLWGRRRLMLLKRLLPFAESLDVHVLGSGLPSFWVIRAGAVTLTFGLTGFTAANWSAAVSFDLMLPRKTQDSKAVESVLSHLGQTWAASSADIGKATGLKGAALAEALQTGCQQGRLMLDLAAGLYRLRPLTEAPIDLNRLEYRNQRERSAHDLLSRRGSVRIVSENRIPGTGLELTGEVKVAEDRRDYRPVMLLSDEGQVSKAECTCTLFRKQGLKAGPCTHLVALRLAYAEQEAKKAKGVDPRQVITVETRAFTRRDESGEDVYQVSLERSRLRVRWGRAGQPMRLQVLRFNTVDEARAAYFARVGELDEKGYIDSTAG